MGPSLRWGDDIALTPATHPVMPAKAGIHADSAPRIGSAWAPAFAGATCMARPLPYQTFTRLSGARYSFWPGWTLNAPYHASRLRTVCTRHGAGAWTSV